VVGISEVPRLLLFHRISAVALVISAQRRATETLRRSRDELQNAIKDQERSEAALLRSEMYLTEAQKLSGTGSFGWNIVSGEIVWSDQTVRIFELIERRSRPWNSLSSAPTLRIAPPCNRPLAGLRLMDRFRA